MSGTERAKPPTVSSDSARLLTPARGIAPKVGLKPTMPLMEPAVRAQRERHHVVGHRRGRAAGRTAGRMGLVARIARGAGRVGGEFGGDGLADHDRAGASAQRHRGGIQAGMMAFVDGRAVARGQVNGVEQVLHADGQAVQRTAASSCSACSSAACFRSAVQAWMVFSRCSMRAKQARTNYRGQFAPLQLARRQARQVCSRQWTFAFLVRCRACVLHTRSLDRGPCADLPIHATRQLGKLPKTPVIFASRHARACWLRVVALLPA